MRQIWALYNIVAQLYVGVDPLFDLDEGKVLINSQF